MSLQCIGTTNTWSHQRRRRKLTARLSQLEQPETTLEENVSDQPAEIKTVSKAELQSQLDSLNVPCRLEFTCTLEENHGPQAKKRKTDEDLSDIKGGVMSLSLELLAGDSKDSLHQILQLIQNRLQTL